MRASERTLQGILWALLIVVLVGVVGAGVWSLVRGSAAGGRGIAGPGPPRPPVYGRIPGFALRERSGRPVTEADLRGRVWVANFIYTHCPDTCPLQSAQMARLQEEFRREGDLRLVSITVDPARDTPEVLSRYAGRFGADPERWLFLTGPREAIFHLAREGFRLGVGQTPAAAPSPLDRAFPPESPPASRRTPVPDGAAAGVVARLVAGAARWRLGAAPALAHDGAPPAPILHSSRFVSVDRRGRIRGYYESGDEEALRRLRRDLRALLGDPAS